MSFAIFLGLGLVAIAFGIKAQEEVAQLVGAFVGAILLVWGLSLILFQFVTKTDFYWY